MFRGWVLKLATINLLIAALLVLGTTSLAEEVLTIGTEKHIGWLQGDSFITCKGDRLAISGGRVDKATETEKCPTVPPIVVVQEQETGAGTGKGIAASGLSTAAIAGLGIGLGLLVIIIIIIL